MRDRKRKREGERDRKRKKVGGRERYIYIEREGDVEYGCFIFKRNDGCLGTF